MLPAGIPAQNLGDKPGSRRLRLSKRKLQINFAFHPVKVGGTYLFGEMQTILPVET